MVGSGWFFLLLRWGDELGLVCFYGVVLCDAGMIYEFNVYDYSQLVCTILC
jgi:hypothetical protein